MQQTIKEYECELLETNEQKESLHELYQETLLSKRMSMVDKIP
jgi:uncharacterized radical SAM superfamily Fe-S cluster-containing enzyme